MSDRGSGLDPGPEAAEAAWSADVELLGYVSRSPLATVRPAGDGFAFVTGLPDNTRNAVVCSRLPAASADEQVAELLDWFGERHVPAQWRLAAHAEPPDLGERLERAGCRPERTAVFMALDLAGRDFADSRPAGVDIATVGDAGELAEAFAGAHVRDADREQPERELALLTSLGLGDGRPLRRYAARRHGRPVGMASAFATASTLNLTDLVVAPGERRRGIGRALVLHALRAGGAAGSTRAVLAPTPATIPFYAPIGFRLGRLPPDRCFYTPFP